MAALIAIGAASIVYVVSRGVTGPTASRPSPSPSVVASSANLSCPPTELKLTGVFDECAAIDKGQSCPTGSFDQPRVVLLHGTKDDFLLYIEVNGAYHGPGTYALMPWPHANLGVADGVAKVALRESTTGALWESSAGSLMIGQSEEFGWVYAGLGASESSPVDVALNIAGWWSCS
ncbi:MAG: hypothetical protein WB682_11685 [Candidatus Dormiibacterota bacterium]